MSEELVLSFEPRTIEHLGLQMYSTLPNALAELIANAYDADAQHVQIALSLSAAGEQTVVVEDDGHGMSVSDLNEKYLRIGRNRRLVSVDEEVVLTESGKRRVSGKKGVGKLALFGIGNLIRIRTHREDSPITSVEMDWQELLSSQGEYRPKFDVSGPASGKHGTRIEITRLNRISPIIPGEVARSLSRLFDYVDGTFEVSVIHATGKILISPDLRFSGSEIEASWSIPKDLPAGSRARTYFESRGIHGDVLSTAKPLRQNMRGLTLYVHGRLANEAEFFGAAESSYAFSYLTGSLSVDFLDDIKPDVIATDRRAINFEAPETAELRARIVEAVTHIAGEWRKKRDAIKRQKTEKRGSRDFTRWTESVGGREAQVLESLLDTIVSSDVDADDVIQDRIIDDLERLIPEYARLHWRHLHSEIQDAGGEDYRRGDYIRSVDESIKRFVYLVKTRSGVSAAHARDIVSQAFGKANNGTAKPLSVFARFMNESVPSQFSSTTAANVEDAQMLLSQGVVVGFRNAIAHEEKSFLLSSGAMTAQDCLDLLSILSHLMRRLDGATQTP